MEEEDATCHLDLEEALKILLLPYACCSSARCHLAEGKAHEVQQLKTRDGVTCI